MEKPAIAASGMRLVIASPGGLGGGGGIGSVTRALVGQLRAAGARVDVIDPWGEHPAWAWPAHLVKAAVQLAWLRIARRSTLLHLQVSQKSSYIRKGLLLMLGRALGMRTVLHHHGSGLVAFVETARPAMRRWIGRSVRAAGHNIVLGDRAKALLVDAFGLDPRRVTVMRNATEDLSTGSADSRAPGEDFTLLLLANLSPRKGVGELLQAVRALRAEGLPVRAVLAGGGEVQRYRDEASGLGIADAVAFTGWIARERVVALLRAADALVLPSHAEGLPMAILEALSARVPVVTTPVGAIPEVLTDGVTCLLVPPGDVAALTAALRRLVADAALRARLVAAGRALFEARFAIEGYMARLLELYAEVFRREHDA